MPRYLALDYLSLVIQDKRELLNSMLLTVPYHMEKLDFYAHSGKISDKNYMQPWSRAKINPLPGNAEQETRVLLKSFSHENCNQLAHYSRVANVDYGSVEVVPSSNPDSQESFGDEVLAQLATKAEKKAEFDEEFKLMTKAEAAVKDDEGKLEEPFSVHGLSSFLDNLPTIPKLVKRLQVKPVSDPFAAIDDKQWLENYSTEGCEIFAFSSKNSQHITTDSAVEEYVKMGLQKNNFIDESINFVEDLDNFKKESKTLTPKQLVDELKLEQGQMHVKLDQEELYRDMNKLEYDDCVKMRETELPHERLLSPLPDTTKENNTDFVVINVEGAVGAAKASILLESPETLIIEKADLDHHSVLQTLRSDNVNLFEKNEFILSPRSKEKIAEEVMICEKILDDILSLRIPESEKTSAANLYNIAPKFAIEVFDLQNELCGSTLELSLPWDPIEYSASDMARVELAERQLQVNVLPEKFTESELTAGEEFHKFNIGKTNQHEEKITITQSISEDINEGKCELEMKTVDDNHATSSRILYEAVEAISQQEELNVSTKCDMLDDQFEEATKVNQQKALTTNLSNTIPPVHSDPVEAFMILRSEKMNSKKSPNKSGGGHQQSSSNSTPLLNKKSTRPSNVQQFFDESPVTPTRCSRKKSKSRIIDVSLTDDFKKILLGLKKAAQPMLSLLRKKGLIPPTHDFEAFTPDVTNFIRKQHEKSHQNDKNIAASQGVFKCVIGLHCLVSTADIVIHCCLQSAIVRLTTLQERHQSILSGSLENIRQYLYSQHFIHQQEQIVHPKVAVLYQSLHEWISKKKIKSPNGDHKMVIMVDRELPSLQAYIQDIGAISSKKVPVILPHGLSATCQEIMTSLEDYDCLIMRSSQIQDDFPWAQFSMVVQYENQTSSEILTLCERQSIRFISLKMRPITKIHITNEQVNDMLIKKTDDNLSLKNPQCLLIGSEKLTGTPYLLQLLEARYEIMILERQYSKLQHCLPVHQADIVLDEKNGITLLTYDEIQQVKNLNSIKDKLVALSLQFQQCWIIIHPKNRSSNQYCFAGNAVRYLADLQTFVNHLSIDGTVTFKIGHSTTFDETAILIKSIIENLQHNDSGQNQDKWINRSWLSYEMSEQEKSLLSLPCFNSYSAQLLLKYNNLQTLMNIPREELSSRYPSIPDRIITMFYGFIGRDNVSRNVGLKSGEQKRLPESGPPVITEDECTIADMCDVNVASKALTDSDTDSSAFSQNFPNEFDRAFMENSVIIEDCPFDNNSMLTHIDQQVPTIFPQKKAMGRRHEIKHTSNQNSTTRESIFDNVSSNTWMDSPQNFAAEITKPLHDTGPLNNINESDAANRVLLEDHSFTRQQRFQQRRPEFEMQTRGDSANKIKEKSKPTQSLMDRAGVPAAFQQYIWRAKAIEENRKPVSAGTQRPKLWTEFGDRSTPSDHSRRNNKDKPSSPSNISTVMSNSNPHLSSHTFVPRRTIERPMPVQQASMGVQYRDAQNAAPRTVGVSHLPVIAPVTPRCRRPLHYDQENEQHISLDNINSRQSTEFLFGPTSFANEDSPPMDLEEFYTESRISNLHAEPWQDNKHQLSGKPTQVSDQHRGMHMYGTQQQIDDTYEPHIFEHGSAKKAKLTYQKIPGAPGGQTRLRFH